MALFDNVTYTYYTETLGRQEVPNADAFNKYKTENVLYIKSLINDGLIIEREPDGIDAACCMCIEADYNAAEIAAGNTALIGSESIGGYSYSSDNKAANLQAEKDVKSTAEIKYKWISLYCHVLNTRA